MDRRVVITGLGVVSPIGVGVGPFHESLSAGASGVRRIEAFDPSGFPCTIAGELVGFSARDYMPKWYRKAIKIMARDIEVAVAAADLAVRDAGLVTKGVDESNPQVDSARMGVNIGAGLICADLTELGAAVEHAVENGKFSLARWGREGMTHLTPLWLLKYLPNMLSSHVTIIHDAQGPSNTVTCADASSILSVGEAFRTVTRGHVDVELCGGAESKLNPMGLLRHCLLKRVTVTHNDSPAKALRPFDKARDGTVIGEGGAVLVLEESARAVRRGARVYAELAGFGSAAAAFSVTDPEPDGCGVADAISAALDDAKMKPDQIDLIVPHGLGLKQHDQAEAAGIRGALGERAGRVPTWPIMGQVGNTGAGAGSLALSAAVLAIHKQRVPAAVNCDQPDPACGLNVSSSPIDCPIRAAVVINYSQGGQSAAVVVRRCDL